MTNANVLRGRRALAGCAVALLCSVFAAAAANADPAPVRIAVFGFELDDFSGGAGLAGNSAADRRHLDQATSEARRLLAQSGRYSLVEVSAAEDEAAKEHTLHQCHGCEAAIAFKLGAEQSFVGVVTRISRTDYAVRFEIRDARSGDLIRAQNSDLRLGADYSWSRGAAALIESRLLGAPRGARRPAVRTLSR